MIKLKQLLTEKTVRLSTMKDANFEPGQFVQLMGKKGMVKLDKKSVHKLAKIVRQLSGKKGMGWSFTMEGKLTESSPYKTASRNELAMYISQLSTTIKNTKDRKMLNMLKKDKKEVEKELKSRKTNEGNIGITTKKGKSIELTHKTSGKEIVVQNTPSVLKKYKKLGYLISMPEGKLTEAETMKLSDVWKDYVKKYGKEKAAEKLMDILTMGAWASWDGDRIKRFKKEIIKKFSKFMKEGKLNEFGGGSKVVTLPNGVKVKIEFDGLTFIGGTKPVFLDRNEMMTFFKATARYLK